MRFLQQNPIVVEVVKQPEPTRDVSVDAVVGMFALAGVAILLAILGGVIVGAIIVGIKRLREGSDGADAPADTSHVRLRI